ncbi:MAG: hypothetical protein M8467_19310 [Anaerolineae bacterium]|nr:hypothetical protein [Anaerolineae bacterium]
MTQPPVPSGTMVTFVVRFWRETADGKLRWRGQIEHVQSGRQTDFLEIRDLLGFLEHFGIVTARPMDNTVPAQGPSSQ